jgi:hypothetical protein
MSENKECLFYIDHNPPEYSCTWGGAIHEGACKVNSTDCKDTDRCFIKKLYNKLKRKEQECEELKEKINEIEKIIDNGTADTQTNNAKWLQQHYLARFCEIRNVINRIKESNNEKIRQDRSGKYVI